MAFILTVYIYVALLSLSSYVSLFVDTWLWCNNLKAASSLNCLSIVSPAVQGSKSVVSSYALQSILYTSCTIYYKSWWLNSTQYFNKLFCILFTATQFIFTCFSSMEEIWKIKWWILLLWI